jgi:peptidoglycan/xylan/chitin deacetylase (PgdA/CDA1 family)
MVFGLALVAMLVAVVAAKAAAVLWAQSRQPAVLCLMYHRLAPRQECERIQGGDRHYTVAVEEMEKQITYLKKRGFRFLSADQARLFAKGDLELDQPGVLLTFDDGCVSVFEWALPLLQRHGVGAVAFVTTDADSYVFGYGQRRMNDEELHALEAAGIHCESHGVTHRPLVQLSDEELRAELGASKAKLEQILGREVKFLSAPGNWIDKRVVDLAKEAGYEAIWVSEPGSLQSGSLQPSSVRSGSDVFGLPRLNVDGTLTLDQFAALLTPWGVTQRYLIYAAKSLPKRLAGPRLWYAFRSALLPWVPGGYLSFARWRLMVTVPVVFVALLALIKALT